MKKQQLSRPAHLLFLLALLFNLAGIPAPSPIHAVVTTANPILFVTQFPIRRDFTTIGAVFGNHKASMQDAGRGGDLWIRYGDGSLKNLTQTAGYGSTNASGFQDRNAIAVRDPSIYWDGTKALFSMVIGAPESRYQTQTYYWQIYEISGLGKNETPVITKVQNQPVNFNNISPIYGTDDRIIFTTDRPRNGAAHLYPQLDEYEEAPTVSGLWSLDPITGNLFMMNHAPSGDFTPIVDSFGRVIFTQWDHLQRDQQADADKFNDGDYGTFNWSDESANATALNDRTEIFPEPRAAQEAAGTNLAPHTFNQFLPWQINEDGTSSETLNHIGRHELNGYIPGTFTDDANIKEYYGQVSRFNQNRIGNFLQIKETSLNPGTYIGTDAPEFGTHASGQIISMTAPPGLDADHISITYITHRDTEGTTATANHSGHYRDPLPLEDGALIAAHTSQTAYEANNGPSIYDFRLKTLTLSGNGFYIAAQPLTAGISKTISFWNPDTMVTYSGPMWELQPVEVRPRLRPTKLVSTLGLPEQQMFDLAGVNVAEFQIYMRNNNIALIVSHNVTTRDDFDFEQPLNLHIPNGTQTIDKPGKIYNIQFLQLFQADQLRGLGGADSPRAGRRVIAQLLHDANVTKVQPLNLSGPSSSVILGLDGSMAAFVPAQRAMTWQLTDPSGVGVVRERVWITFQPGEIRVCGSCHGVNDKDQAGNPPPMNQPQALLDLLQYWKTASKIIFADVPSSYWSNSYIERLYNAGITGGCSTVPLNYCPDSTVTRAQMAVFLLKGMHGSSYAPPTVGGSTGFNDVATSYWAAAWIKQLAAEGITSGCGAGNYCPDAVVTRAQMAIFLLKAKHGSFYTPPTASGIFTDVPVGYWADKWIEQLGAEGVTSGCGAGMYCPDIDVTRAQMAVFLVKTFNLP